MFQRDMPWGASTDVLFGQHRAVTPASSKLGVAAQYEQRRSGSGDVAASAHTVVGSRAGTNGAPWALLWPLPKASALAWPQGQGC